jgi:two-component system, LuxR family, response regulator FixJ
MHEGAQMKKAGTASADIYVVDGDASVRDALARLLGLEGFHVSGFAEGDALLAAVRRRPPACIILDVHVPARSGLDILEELHHRSGTVPLLVTSDHGDVAMAVDAIRKGALDFIEKPFNAETLVTRVREAVAATPVGKPRPAADPGVATPRSVRELLTPREYQVLKLIADGTSNKQIGRELGISPRTVEVHRAHVMEKLGARNAVDLVRIMLSERG